MNCDFKTARVDGNFEAYLENTMLVSFDIKFIRRDQKQRKNGKACRAVIESTMLVSFIIKFIRRDQKQRRNDEACRAVIESTMLVSFNTVY